MLVRLTEPAVPVRPSPRQPQFSMPLLSPYPMLTPVPLVLPCGKNHRQVSRPIL
jgi:hypothetical protein